MAAGKQQRGNYTFGSMSVVNIFSDREGYLDSYGKRKTFSLGVILALPTHALRLSSLANLNVM